MAMWDGASSSCLLAARRWRGRSPRVRNSRRRCYVSHSSLYSLSSLRRPWARRSSPRRFRVSASLRSIQVRCGRHDLARSLSPCAIWAMWTGRPSPLTTFPRMAMGSGFQPSLRNVCASRRTSSTVSTTPAAKVAKNTTRTIPIVMVGLGDPVGTGLVESLAQPGGNITGMSQMAPELAAKRLALLLQAVPGISRVLVLSYLDDPIAPLQVKALNEAARSLGVALQVQSVRSGDDLSAAFDAGARERVDGLLTTAESMFVVHRARMIGLAAHHRLPAMYPYSSQVEAGGLMAYDIDTSDLQRRAAIYVDRILNGAKPSDLPVQQPTKFNFVINLKTAKALGLNLPEKMLALADRVIE